ncbi:uncharacterized protein LOC131398511 isoform X5 [Diceros bicornis minor]|uniref:uncharacterized protein LOC131398511 isoform X5 n=1 Tax=Diceros bicornis minor TaxID=77932 RepID=UPI0026EF33A4|nr:uncharacterized protein LOC131398511 isoform X5 [Diceros bicornis minor]
MSSGSLALLKQGVTNCSGLCPIRELKLPFVQAQKLGCQAQTLQMPSCRTSRRCDRIVEPSSDGQACRWSHTCIKNCRGEKEASALPGDHHVCRSSPSLAPRLRLGLRELLSQRVCGPSSALSSSGFSHVLRLHGSSDVFLRVFSPCDVMQIHRTRSTFPVKQQRKERRKERGFPHTLQTPGVS